MHHLNHWLCRAWRPAICLFIFISLIPAQTLHSHLRFVGPNPYYSFLTFPQDISLFKPGTSFVFFTYDNRGWMGHLDQPQISPQPGYIATSETITQNIDNNPARAEFSGTWLSPKIDFVPMVTDLGKLRLLPYISGNIQSFNLSSSGTAIANGATGDFQIPYTSELAQNNTDLSLGIIARFDLGTVPVGIRASYRMFDEGSPAGFIEYTVNGITNRYSRYNWGWSTVFSCGHIFGPPTNIDAFWQDFYTDTSYSLFDLVFAADLKNNRIGFHFRNQAGRQDYLEYDPVHDIYQQLNWSDNLNKYMYRFYDVARIATIGIGELYLLGLLEYDHTRNPVIHQGIELKDHFREAGYNIELIPFIHFELPEKGFFRFGSGFNIFYKDFANNEVWGSQEVYGGGWAWIGWEQPWERASYGDKFTWGNFTEANLELVIVKQPRIVIESQVWSQFAVHNTNLYYGQTQEVSEGIFNFFQSASRNSYLRELWIGGSIGFRLEGKITFGLFADIPIHYDSYRNTEITAANGEYFYGESNTQPLIRKPVQIRAQVVWDW